MGLPVGHNSVRSSSTHRGQHGTSQGRNVGDAGGRRRRGRTGQPSMGSRSNHRARAGHLRIQLRRRDDHLECQHRAARTWIGAFGSPSPAEDLPGWSAEAHWQVGSWIMFVDEPAAVVCDDGTEHNMRVNYSWDAAADSGSRSFLDTGICDGEAQSVSAPYTLTRLGPPPAPPPVEVPPPPPLAPLLLPPLAAEAVPPPPGVPLPPLAAEAPPAPNP